MAILTGCGASGSSFNPGEGSPGLAPGFMKVAFRVAAPLRFSKYRYLIIFNTSGSGSTPEANSWAGYSFMFETASRSGTPYAMPIAFVRNRNPHVPPAQVVLQTLPGQFAFTAKSDRNGSEFTILFARSIFSAKRAHESHTSDTWLFNAFSNSRNGFLDSMGSCGSCFSSPKLSADKAFDETVDASKKPKGIDPSAKIVSVEFANNP